MPHSVSKDITSACWRGDRIAASMLTSVHTEWHRLSTTLAWQRVYFPRHPPPTIGCVPCKFNPAPIAGRYSAAPCRPTALELADSEKVWPSLRCSPSMSRRQAAALPACLALLRVLEGPAPRPKPSSLQVWVLWPQESNITARTHAPWLPSSAQGSWYSSPGERSRDTGA
jgi:hypothetical protein